MRLANRQFCIFFRSGMILLIMAFLSSCMIEVGNPHGDKKPKRNTDGGGDVEFYTAMASAYLTCSVIDSVGDETSGKVGCNVTNASMEKIDITSVMDEVQWNIEEISDVKIEKLPTSDEWQFVCNLILGSDVKLASVLEKLSMDLLVKGKKDIPSVTIQEFTISRGRGHKAAREQEGNPLGEFIPPGLYKSKKGLLRPAADEYLYYRLVVASLGSKNDIGPGFVRVHGRFYYDVHFNNRMFGWNLPTRNFADEAPFDYQGVEADNSRMIYLGKPVKIIGYTIEVVGLGCIDSYHLQATEDGVTWLDIPGSHATKEVCQHSEHTVNW